MQAAAREGTEDLGRQSWAAAPHADLIVCNPGEPPRSATGLPASTCTTAGPRSEACRSAANKTRQTVRTNGKTFCSAGSSDVGQRTGGLSTLRESCTRADGISQIGSAKAFHPSG